MGPFLLPQVVYKEKDSDSAVHFWTVEGNTTHSVQLAGLGKYVLYEIQVLAFTRIGDGRPSSPTILERTLDDGRVKQHWQNFNVLDSGYTHFLCYLGPGRLVR